MFRSRGSRHPSRINGGANRSSASAMASSWSARSPTLEYVSACALYDRRRRCGDRERYYRVTGLARQCLYHACGGICADNTRLATKGRCGGAAEHAIGCDGRR